MRSKERYYKEVLRKYDVDCIVSSDPGVIRTGQTIKFVTVDNRVTMYFKSFELGVFSNDSLVLI